MSGRKKVPQTEPETTLHTKRLWLRLKKQLDLLAVTLDLPVEQVVNRVIEKGIKREKQEGNG